MVLFGGEPDHLPDETTAGHGRERLKFLLTAAAMVLVIVSSSGQGRAESQDGVDCKDQHLIRTGGTASTEYWARKRARDAWRQKAEETIGKKWSAWYLAKDHAYSCSVENDKRRCTAKAIPCRSTVVLQGPRKICNLYQINATGVSAQMKAWAKHNARSAWSERVRMIIGDDFDTWLLANSRQVECKVMHPDRHYCKAKATPCRFILFN